jgi:pyridoxine 4-dehydrogenase
MKFSLNVNVVVLAILVAGAEAFVERAPKLRLARATCPISAVSQGEGESRREFFQKAAAVPAVVACVASAVAGLPKAAAADVVTASSGIEFPPMGLGAWAWGDSLFWGYNPKNDEELRKVFDYAVDNSKSKTTLFDTAEIYGFGRSEKLIGDFSKKYDQDKIQVATKFAALPFRSKAQDVVKAAQASSDRLGRPIDLYQIHFPNAWSNAEYWDGLAMAYDKGLVKAVGVSNYGVDATRACHAALAKRGIPLASNQIQMSLLYRYPLENGLSRACEDLGVKVLSYSPLALGMLTGKYTLDAPPQGPRQALFKALKTTPDYDNLLATMKDVAAGHGDATLSQVALNWGRAKNSIPIPGARTLSQVQQNYGALEWKLSEGDVKALDLAAGKVTTFSKPESMPFPKEDINTHLKMFDC